MTSTFPRLLLVSALLMAALGVSCPAKDRLVGPKNATILIIRHGEKVEAEDKKDIGLSEQGAARAQAYVEYFIRKRIDGSSLKPDVIFATHQSKNSNRPRLTVEPLAEKLGLKIKDRYEDAEVGELTDKMRSGEYDGKTILIAWHRGMIPELIQQLGGDPGALIGPGENKEKWPPSVFGWLVVLRYDAAGALKESKVINEKLMADDTKDPPAGKP